MENPVQSPSQKALMDEVRHRHDMAHEAMMREAGKPLVGLFWVVDGKLIIDGVPLSEAATFATFGKETTLRLLAYPRSPELMWARYQRIGAVSKEMAWDAAPRGWVTYEAHAETFYLTADSHILNDDVMMQRIMEDMNLPLDTVAQSSLNYRCSRCCE